MLLPLLRENLLLGERGESEVRLDDAELGEEGLGLLVLDGGVHDDVLTGDPVDGCGDAVLVAGLQGVDDAQDLGGVAAGGGWVGEDGADGLLGVDDEDGADGEGNTLLIDVGGILLVDPANLLVQFPTQRSKGRDLTCRRAEKPCAPYRQ
jgi:hypothetical protein